MNELQTVETTDVLEAPTGAALMMNPNSMRALMTFAEQMAMSTITVPKHLQGKPADCLAIAMQAAQWGMNPFAVAQKTHIVNGTLGYEAQLVNAVITSGPGRAVDGHFHYEYRGAAQEMECRVGAVPRGNESGEIVWGEWLRNGDVKVRNSPLWATNPKQQLGYLQVKNWARAYCPGSILGVYTPDEIVDIEPGGGAPVSRGPKRKSEAAPTPMVDEVPKDEQGPREEPAPAAAAASAPAEQPAQAAAPKAPLPNNGAGISGGQVAYLRNKLKAAGLTEQTICDRFQVGGIELLSAGAFDEIKSELLAAA